MNRSRSAPKTPASVFVTVGLAMVVAITGGAMNAVCKNRQVMTEREIDAAEKRIGQLRLDIQITGVRMDELQDRFELRDRLRQAGSSTVAVAHGDIIDVAPPALAPAVATAMQP